jgi:hypothetical protein
MFQSGGNRRDREREMILSLPVPYAYVCIVYKYLNNYYVATTVYDLLPERKLFLNSIELNEI